MLGKILYFTLVKQSIGVILTRYMYVLKKFQTLLFHLSNYASNRDYTTYMQPLIDSCKIFAKSLRRTCMTSLPNFRACRLGKLVLILREISSQDRLCGATSLWTSIAVSTKYQ